MKTFNALALGTILALSVFGCSLLKGEKPTPAQCSALLIASEDATLVGKCEQSNDKLNNSACITISTLRTAAALCLANAETPVAP